MSEGDPRPSASSSSWPRPEPSTLFLEVPGGERSPTATPTAARPGSPTPWRALGVEPGDRVAVQVEKSPLAILLYLACVRVRRGAAAR